MFSCSATLSILQARPYILFPVSSNAPANDKPMITFSPERSAINADPESPPEIGS